MNRFYVGQKVLLKTGFWYTWPFEKIFQSDSLASDGSLEPFTYRDVYGIVKHIDNRFVFLWLYRKTDNVQVSLAPASRYLERLWAYRERFLDPMIQETPLPSLEES